MMNQTTKSKTKGPLMDKKVVFKILKVLSAITREHPCFLGDMGTPMSTLVHY